ncbi:MAG: caspase family protein, partial [Pseudorhodoplanes sp.]
MTLRLLAWRLLACVIALVAWAGSVAPASADRQVAFVVGNSRYDKAEPLANAKRDAAAVADRLRDLGVEVTEVFDGDAFTLNRAAERFVAQARNADLALFYFAGHGIQLFDQNFLLARDVDPNKIAEVSDLGLDLTSFMARLRSSGAVRVALLIDACRINPFPFEETVRLVDLVRKAGAGKAGAAADAAAGTRGLARVILVEPKQQRTDGNAETLFFFAAQPGQVSFDGTGQNSFFVESLKEELSRTGRPLTEVFRNVSAYVRTVTKGEQVPQVVSDWTGDVVLGGGAVERVAYQVISSD